MGLGTSSETYIALSLYITNLLLTNPIMCIWITLGRWEDVRYIENKIFMSVRKNVPNALHTTNMPGTKEYRDRLWGGPVSPGQCCFGGRCHLCFAIHYLCNLEHTAVFSSTWHIASNRRLQLHSDCSSSTVYITGGFMHPWALKDENF